MALTGHWQFRKSFRGKVVLQIEEEVTPFWSRSGDARRRWRDATVSDLAEAELRAVIDLGLKRRPGPLPADTSPRAQGPGGAGRPAAPDVRGDPHRVAH